jgi:hypothetical protein
MWITLPAILFGILLLNAAFKDPRTAGRRLNNGFRELGNMAGKTKRQIIGKVGPPQTINNIPNGDQVFKWIAYGYSIEIRFDANGKFMNIESEKVM